MSTPDTVATPSRNRQRGVIAGAASVAVLIAAGVAAALLIPGGGPAGGVGGPDVGLAAGSEEIGILDGRGHRGPWRERGLGDDTLLVGTVVSAGDGSLVVAPDVGAQHTVRTDDDTRVRGWGNAALDDLEAGERVVVRVDGTGDAATAVAIWAPRARIAGTVTALEGTGATVTTIDGLTVAVDVAGLDRQPAVGDVVVVAGAAADGTTITAESIRILPRAS